MTQNSSTDSSRPSGRTSSGFKLSEDWIATIIGLVIVLAIGAGLIGPGPQSVSLKAKPGETVTADALAVAGWKVSATLGGEKSAVENAVTGLQKNAGYVVACQDGKIASESALPDGSEAPANGRALLVLVNDCDSEVSISYKIDAAIPWPVFGIFDR